MEYWLLNGQTSLSSSPIAESNNEFATYLCQEVFNDMSVLPLVFPSNISCFSRGSYKEELARKRELPVPPLPKRSGVLARSDDNISGLNTRGSMSQYLSLMDHNTSTQAIPSFSSSCKGISNKPCMTRYNSDTKLLLNLSPGIMGDVNLNLLVRDADQTGTNIDNNVEPIQASPVKEVQSLGSDDSDSVTPQISEHEVREAKEEMEDGEGCDKQSVDGSMCYLREEDWCSTEMTEASYGEETSDQADQRSLVVLGEALPEKLCGSENSDSCEQGSEEEENDCRSLKEGEMPTNSEEYEQSDKQSDNGLICYIPEDVDCSNETTDASHVEETPDRAEPGTPVGVGETRAVKLCSSEEMDSVERSGGEECDTSSLKMNLVKKSEKSSLFRTAIDRLSFRTKRKKVKKYAIDIKPSEISKNSEVDISDEISLEKVICDTDKDRTKKDPSNILVLSEEGQTVTLHTNIDTKPTLNTKPPPYASPRPPISASSSRTIHVSQLDAALLNFKVSAAKSRENLSLSRTDISDLKQGQGDRADKIRSPTRLKPPPLSASSSWRQKPPPSNPYLDSQWKKLSASMVNLNSGSRNNLAVVETNLSSKVKEVSGSNTSLVVEEKQKKNGLEKEMKMSGEVFKDVNMGDRVLRERAQSMNVLDVGQDNTIGGQVAQCNQLSQLTPHQRRVQASMEKLNLPSWAPRTSTIPTPSTTPSWRQTGGWRRHLTPSTLERSPTTHDQSSTSNLSLERSSLTPSQRYRQSSRFSPLPRTIPRTPGSCSSINSTDSSNPAKPVYLGWRQSMERLDIGPTYLVSPSQRLACTALPTDQAVLTRSATLPVGSRVDTDIRQVTEAIMDFCRSPQKNMSNVTLVGEEKPPGHQVKEAWCERGVREGDSDDSDNERNSDQPDDDSGIDRSEDFTAEILSDE